MSDKGKTITDKHRLDWLESWATGQIVKKYDRSRGAHWPWFISQVNKKTIGPYDSFREAIDIAIKKEVGNEVRCRWME